LRAFLLLFVTQVWLIIILEFSGKTNYFL